MNDTGASPKTPWLRYALFVLVGLQIALFVVIEADFLLRAPQMDMITRSMNQDFAILLILPLVLLTIPALLLAILNRWLVLALVLAVLPILAVSGLIALINFR